MACSGNILGSGLKAYAVGTAVEGPTFGHLLIFNGRFKRVAAIDCQKVVRMKLLDLLGDSSREIVTWEDHHYGTNTTRRTLVVYKVRGKEISKVFEHDLVDQTHVSHGQVGSPDEPRFEIDLESMKSEKVILVKPDRGEMSRYRWTGNKYEMTCQQGR